MTDITGIKLETIRPIFLLHAAQLLFQMFGSGRIAKVIAGTITVPPRNDGRFIRPPFFDQESFLLKLTKLRAIRTDERANPEHDLESLSVQTINHSFRIRKTFGFKVEIAIIFLPVVIHHEHADRKIILQYMTRIFQDILLILVIHQFDPGIILRHGKEQRIRQITGRWEMFGRSSHISILQRTARQYRLHLLIIGIQTQLSILDLKRKRLVTPNIPSLRRKQKRHVLIVQVLGREVEQTQVTFKRHLRSQADCTAPPFLSFERRYFRFVLARSKAGQCQENQEKETD